MPPLALFKWIVFFLFSLAALLVAVDVFASIARTRLSKSSHFKERLTIIREQNLERYKHECIWHELSVSRQLSLEIKAIFYTLTFQDGVRMLTTNSSGHLVNDEQCLKLL